MIGYQIPITFFLSWEYKLFSNIYCATVLLDFNSLQRVVPFKGLNPWTMVGTYFLFLHPHFLPCLWLHVLGLQFGSSLKGSVTKFERLTSSTSEKSFTEAMPISHHTPSIFPLRPSLAPHYHAYPDAPYFHKDFKGLNCQTGFKITVSVYNLLSFIIVEYIFTMCTVNIM